MANSIRIKRRAASGLAGAPTSLKNGELAYNENDNNLYYGFGDNGSGVATSIPVIGGVQDALLQDIADISWTATAADQFIVSTGVGTFALESGNTARSGLGLGTGDSPEFTGLTTTSNVSIGGTLNGHTIPGGAGTLALTTDALATTSGHNYITLSGQDIVQGDVALGTHTSGNYIATLAALSGSAGITIGSGTGESAAATVTVDSSVIRTTGGQSIAGTTTLSTLSVSDNATVTGDLTVSTDFEAASTVTFSALANADADVDKFLVSDSGDVKFRTGAEVLSDIGGAPAAGSTSITTLGTITTGTWGATDIAVAHGGTGASTAAAARTNLGVDAAGTDNSTDVTLAGAYDYITISGQVITRNQIDLTADVTGLLPNANINSVAASKITGTLASARLPEATSSAKGAIELFSDTDQSVAANAVSATASRTYGIQLNSAGQGVVNVPWTDTQNSRADLGLDTDDTVVFGNIETAGYLRGPSNFTIDPDGHGDATGTVTIEGNLTVNGTTTTVSSTSIEIADKDLQLAKDTGLANLTGAGLLLGQGSGGAEVSFLFEYNSGTNQKMVLDTALEVEGGLKDTVIDGGTF